MDRRGFAKATAIFVGAGVLGINLKKDNLRIVERVKDGQWQRVRLIELKEGDCFRMFDPDGTPVTASDGENWQCTDDAYIYRENIADEGIASVYAKTIKEAE